ncbi:Zinc metalloproteinase aureolysin [Cucumis melo var. makuwa]|uniref:Zinc metalloproteinase aureolysin n=1 Tax=Cucumis melo var. makuwa TaxID=1194695 RepID=A0A5A7VLE1_CUCMM|nr:Zinc metalloproteinase aureolysin [Cucumis melo var. makuwa]TYK18088.1 Zinc metalloproteinase aureolysin [Cucumis melo var. makuwa]
MAQWIRRWSTEPEILGSIPSGVVILSTLVSTASYHRVTCWNSNRGQLEQEMETVIRVLQPGPLGIIEHKFSAEEMRRAQSTVREAILSEVVGGKSKAFLHIPLADKIPQAC